MGVVVPRAPLLKIFDLDNGGQERTIFKYIQFLQGWKHRREDFEFWGTAGFLPEIARRSWKQSDNIYCFFKSPKEMDFYSFWGAITREYSDGCIPKR